MEKFEKIVATQVGTISSIFTRGYGINADVFANTATFMYVKQLTDTCVLSMSIFPGTEQSDDTDTNYGK